MTVHPPLAVFCKRTAGEWVFVAFGSQELIVAHDRAHVAQLAEHVLGKDEVISSNLIMGSRLLFLITVNNENVNTR